MVLGVPVLAAMVTVLVLAPAWPAWPATVMVMGLVMAWVVVVPPTPPDDTTIILTPPPADTCDHTTVSRLARDVLGLS